MIRKLHVITILFSFLLIFTPLTIHGLDCPKGAYVGRDNLGNEACRDIETNQIIDPETGLMFDSQTGEVILNDEQKGYIAIGIFIFIIIVVAITAASRKSKGKQIIPRNEFTEKTKNYVMDLQGGRCARCNKRPKAWDFHHKGRRDDNSARNCEGLCLDCHRVVTLTERKDEHSREND